MFIQNVIVWQQVLQVHDHDLQRDGKLSRYKSHVVSGCLVCSVGDHTPTVWCGAVWPSLDTARADQMIHTAYSGDNLLHCHYLQRGYLHRGYLHTFTSLHHTDTPE